MKNLKEVVLITGGSKGIGRGIAEFLLSKGYQVAITARNESSAKEAANLISKAVGQSSIIGLAYNMEDPSAPEKLIKETIDKLGRLDVLINNSLASAINTPLLESEDLHIDNTIVANISSVVKLCRHAHPHLKVHKGNIINIGSSITKRYVNGLPLYAMVKAGLIKLTEALAAEWQSDGIRLNIVNPGFTQSSAAKDMGLSDDQIEETYKHLNQFQPLGSALPSDIAPTIGFLISDDARMITGSIIDVDGGHHIQGHSLLPASLFS